MLCLAIVRRAPAGSPNAKRSTAAGPTGWTTIGGADAQRNKKRG
ncbi:anthranilate synthase [Burkholderia thailandensis]|nr:anthranilate synthase [Burkholderia thailandensis]